MLQFTRGRFAFRSRSFSFLAGCACVLALSVVAGQAYAMWARMTEAELLQKSEWVVVGAWVGQAPAPSSERAAGEIGVIAVSEVLKGRRDASVAFVKLVGSKQPISSSDLRFQRGDRGVWFLRLSAGNEPLGPYVVDHPQRFLRDAPENEAAISALRQQLQRR